MEITENTIKEQAKVVFNLGIEVKKLEEQGVAGYQQQLTRMQDIVEYRVRLTEEQMVLDHMVNTIGRFRANARIDSFVIPEPETLTDKN